MVSYLRNDQRGWINYVGILFGDEMDCGWEQDVTIHILDTEKQSVEKVKSEDVSKYRVFPLLESI